MVVDDLHDISAFNFLRDLSLVLFSKSIRVHVFRLLYHAWLNGVLFRVS